MNNRVKALERDGVEPAWIAQLQQSLDLLEKTESQVNRQLGKLASQHFMADWVTNNAPGLALPGFARFIGVLGSLDNFQTVSKVWKYLGMSVDDGHAPRKERGSTLHYSPRGRVLCHQISDSIVKLNRGPYRLAYDRKKAEYQERERTGPSACPFGQTHKEKGGEIKKCGDAHANNAAMRYAVKMLVKDMWIEWKRRRPS